MIIKDGTRQAVTAVILTGGSGSRMQREGVSKQFIEIIGKPIFIHCLEIYQGIASVDEIVLVIDEKYRPLYNEELEKHPIPKVKQIVSGGKYRHESVQNGVNAVSHDEGLIIIQNGVNPTTSPETIKLCVNRAITFPAVSAYVPAFHTVFLSTEDDNLAEVYDRKMLNYTVDPQIYNVPVIKEALKEASTSEKDLPIVELVREAGHEVSLILSDMSNHKITNSHDLAYVSHVLKSRLHAQEII